MANSTVRASNSGVKGNHPPTTNSEILYCYHTRVCSKRLWLECMVAHRLITVRYPISTALRTYMFVYVAFVVCVFLIINVGPIALF